MKRGTTTKPRPPPPREQFIVVTLEEHRQYCVVELALAAGCALTEQQLAFLDEISARFRAA